MFSVIKTLPLPMRRDKREYYHFLYIGREYYFFTDCKISLKGPVNCPRLQSGLAPQTRIQECSEFLYQSICSLSLRLQDIQDFCHYLCHLGNSFLLSGLKELSRLFLFRLPLLTVGRTWFLCSQIFFLPSKIILALIKLYSRGLIWQRNNNCFPGKFLSIYFC